MWRRAPPAGALRPQLHSTCFGPGSRARDQAVPRGPRAPGRARGRPPAPSQPAAIGVAAGPPSHGHRPDTASSPGRPGRDIADWPQIPPSREAPPPVLAAAGPARDSERPFARRGARGAESRRPPRRSRRAETRASPAPAQAQQALAFGISSRAGLAYLVTGHELNRCGTGTDGRPDL